MNSLFQLFEIKLSNNFWYPAVRPVVKRFVTVKLEANVLSVVIATF